MSLTSLSRVAFQQPALIDVYSPYDGSLVGSVANLTADAVPGLLTRARQGVRESAALPRHRRASILEQAARLIERDAADFAGLIVDEAGKTLRQAERR